MTKKDFKGQWPEEASSYCSSNELHLKKGTKRAAATRETKAKNGKKAKSEPIRIGSMGDNSSMKFLELLAEVCKGSEKSIGSPNDPQFWSLFAGKFSQILRSYWSPEFCESFATKLGMQYLNKDPCNYQLSSNFMNLLELVFVKYAHLLPAFAETQEDPDAIPETPPDKLNPGKLVKRLEGSTSTVRNISQSEGSSLPVEVEIEVRDTILLMAQDDMLTMQQIEFAQNHLIRSTWAAQAFMEKSDMESKREFIVKSMYAPEGLEKNKKQKRCM